ncbi:hypothetical protein SAMN05216184_101299 [Georgenia satyanarayanai]|uniref:DUF2332 domain-containing protein n=1 Tax=Georgenia satyanarayanai TaxID=860221 RepID=A0A2Y9A388_9MICO|nr:DUF2332 domain-containing protein [Georgenia satyanarayanai]PYG01834.1 uncharacterized protein DUF2332 [Georgenia satyanarayanai]SSA36637.1 hypothetical protein SAMN05216184_101299 [Georgenia satyanarayanai]
MDPTIHQGQRPVAEVYRLFAEREARGASPVYEAWASRIAEDAAVLARLETLPPGKRQPNLVLAAARWHGAGEEYRSVRETLLDGWPAVRETILSRATQTNEAGRCATLLPFLAELPQPLALLEVGASAGLCLLPDRYSYRYDDGTSLDPDDGPSDVVLECRLGEGVTAPTAMPQVAWRAGLDLAPVDVTDADARAWLETLVWPGQELRRRRLAAALDVARREPPAIVRGDLLTDLPALAATAPADATLVVFHSAVLAYVPADVRDGFVDLVTDLPGHWMSNEGQAVLPEVWTARDRADGRFLLAVGGVPRALTGPHGASVDGLGRAAG